MIYLQGVLDILEWPALMAVNLEDSAVLRSHPEPVLTIPYRCLFLPSLTMQTIGLPIHFCAATGTVDAFHRCGMELLRCLQ